ncbi:hypothetical protein E5D57_007671 [Metarhizium anisopliae]|nr:hypothetical protein E5D57_007671 [Metarhizium anisopliae]
MLLSKARERDLVGNRVPEEMTAAQARLWQLSEKTVGDACKSIKFLAGSGWATEDDQLEGEKL